MLDIRIPIGLMFLVKGIILVLYGALSDKAQYAISLGVNINLVWGAAMLAFGLLMLAWSKLRPDVKHDDEVVVVRTDEVVAP